MSAPGDDVRPSRPADETPSPLAAEAGAPAGEPGLELPAEAAASMPGSEVPPRPPFYRRSGFRKAVVALGVLLFLFALGLLLPSNFWRF